MVNLKRKEKGKLLKRFTLKEISNMSINVTNAELFNMIESLRERLDLLEGRPRGPISMTEARLANERGDKATVKRFEEQENERIRSERRLSVKTSVLCGASAGNGNQIGREGRAG